MTQEIAKRESRGTIKTKMRYLHPDFLTICLTGGVAPSGTNRIGLLAGIRTIKLSVKHDAVKVGIDKILTEMIARRGPVECIEGCANGMLAGAMKYDPWNFLKGFSVSDITDSLERHLIRYLLDYKSIDEDCTSRLKDGCGRSDGTFMLGYGDDAPSVLHADLILTNINMFYWCESVNRLWDDRGIADNPPSEVNE